MKAATPIKPDLLFVYGTLRAGAGSPMFAFLERHSARRWEAKLEGALYDLGGYPGARPAPRSGDWVRGELYRLTDTARVLQVLDAYEGCGPGEDATLFSREIHRVVPDTGRAARAWVYVCGRPVDESARIDSGDYLAPADD